MASIGNTSLERLLGSAGDPFPNSPALSMGLPTSMPALRVPPGVIYADSKPATKISGPVKYSLEKRKAFLKILFTPFQCTKSSRSSKRCVEQGAESSLEARRSFYRILGASATSSTVHEAA